MTSSRNENRKITAFFNLHFDHVPRSAHGVYVVIVRTGEGGGNTCSDLTISVEYGEMKRSLHLAMAQKS